MDSSQASTAETGPSVRRAVLLPLPLEGVYDYRVPDGMAAEAGAFVTVPLGARRVEGVVWGDYPLTPGAPSGKYKIEIGFLKAASEDTMARSVPPHAIGGENGTRSYLEDGCCYR